MAIKQITPDVANMTEEEKAIVNGAGNEDAIADEGLEGTYSVAHDHSVGSYLISASYEDWKDAIENMRGGDQSAEAETVMTLLRESNGSPAPGARISIELLPGTETDNILDVITNNMNGERIDTMYMRKSKTTRSSAKTKAGGGEKATRSKKSATPRECACGCGEMTGGGTFRPGHDARHKGNLLRAIRAGGDEGTAALTELAKYPTLYNIEKAKGEYGTEAARKAEKEARDKARFEELKAKEEAKKAAAVEHNPLDTGDLAENEDGEEDAE